MMVFKAYAGNMYVGTLTVDNCLHIFLNREGKCKLNLVCRKYKKLNLLRVQ